MNSAVEFRRGRGRGSPPGWSMKVPKDQGTDSESTGGDETSR